jgi:hypothetical protein
MNFYLYVIDAPEEGSTSPMEYVLEYASRAGVIAAHKDNRESGQYPNAQFYVADENGLIVAVEAHDNLLWLERVPPPAYFTKPKTKQRMVGGLPVPERFCSAGMN